MICSRPILGVAPLSADVMAQSLQTMPDVEVVRRITPKSLGVFGAVPGGSPEIIVARMPVRWPL
jgi:hypothetical protein